MTVALLGDTLTADVAAQLNLLAPAGFWGWHVLSTRARRGDMRQRTSLRNDAVPARRPGSAWALWDAAVAASQLQPTRFQQRYHR